MAVGSITAPTIPATPLDRLDALPDTPPRIGVL